MNAIPTNHKYNGANSSLAKLIFISFNQETNRTPQEIYKTLLKCV